MHCPGAGTLPLPEVNTKVTILGKCVGHYPCMIDGMGAGRIFVVGIGGQLTLRDLEVRGGYCNEGAAVLVTGVGSTKPSSSGKLLALNVLFYNNTANTVSSSESSDILLLLFDPFFLSV